MAAKLRIYTTPFCGFCFAAKRFLNSKGVDFEEIGLAGKPDLRAEISKKAGGWSTVPMIFIGDKFIGGFDDLVAMDRAGELNFDS